MIRDRLGAEFRVVATPVGATVSVAGVVAFVPLGMMSITMRWLP